MEYHVGIENVEPGNWVTSVFEWPGCYGRGKTREEALEATPAAIEEMQTRLTKCGFYKGMPTEPFAVKLAEDCRSYRGSPDYIVNVFFENDKLPLDQSDIDYAFAIFELNRGELLNIISELPNNVLDLSIPGEVQKNIKGILRHIGTAEWWYWDRLDKAFPRAERPENILDLLKKVRDFTLLHLPDLIGSDQVTCKSDEFWSPRKLLRRAVWHERVHALQIKRYLRDM